MDTVLSIAGSDPSAGAGIQQDLKTITAMGCYGATVITAITAQNTMGVQGVLPVPALDVQRQIYSVLDDLDVKAVKIGMIPNLEVAVAVVTSLSEHPAAHGVPVVFDPVMVSTSGRELMSPQCLDYIRDRLMRMCTLITPNIPETETLVACKLTTPDVIDMAGKRLCSSFNTAFLIKGGHGTGDHVTDRLYIPDGTVTGFISPRIESTNMHGTGCTLSSAIASALAQGYDLIEAVRMGKDMVTGAILNGQHLGIGHGNGPIWPQSIS